MGVGGATSAILETGGLHNTIAGSGGSSIATGGSPCDVTVHAPNSIQAAIDRAPSPGTVCVTAGIYQENLELRDGVNVRGSGTDAMLCGGIQANTVVALGAEVSQLAILDHVAANGSVRLSLRDLDFTLPVPAGCAAEFPASAVTILRQGAGGLRFIADNLRVSSAGFNLSLEPAGTPLDDVIQITRSRCTNSNQCYDFFDFQIGTQPGEPLAPGSKLHVDVSNNLVQNIVLDGMLLNFSAVLQPEDADQVSVTIRHNTLISKGDSNYAIAAWVIPGVPFVLANNVISYIAHPLWGMDSPQTLQVANFVSSDVSSKSWFENFDSNDFLPSAGSPLLGAGNASYGTDTDIDGHPRSDHYDVGAYQR